MPAKSPYTGPERRSEPHLSEEQLEAIAEKAAEKAIEKLTTGVYKSIGKSVVEKFFYLAGAVAVGAYLWLKNKGVIT